MLFGLFLSKKEKCFVTGTLYNIIKNERREHPNVVQQKWTLFFAGYMAGDPRSGYLYFVSDHRPLLVKMAKFVYCMRSNTLGKACNHANCWEHSGMIDKISFDDIKLELAELGVIPRLCRGN